MQGVKTGLAHKDIWQTSSALITSVVFIFGRHSGYSKRVAGSFLGSAPSFVDFACSSGD